MIYKVIENYLDENFCKLLIDDAEKYSKNDHIKVLNNRLLLPSTSLSFINLINNSEYWNKLHNKINSQNFLDNLMSNLDIKNENFKVTNFFFNKNPSTFLNRYKTINSKQLSTIGNINLIFYQIFKIFRLFQRILKFRFTNKNYVELLYDYSKSPNGYKREIHRDSDARTIVFLIYLNNLSSDGEGGDLRLYEYRNKNQSIPARPSSKDCDIINKISPKTGRLVTFLNSHDSLHDVSEMKNHNGFRHFLYGSFTLLAKKNPLLKNSLGKLKTNYNIFE
tara:strand:+ start:2495 stop:3328 length:834 start_codon:yes stop_codon:yes gene_type:complete